MPKERRWLAVTAIGLSLFLSALDATIVALALPSIAHHFQLSASLASMVTLSYTIPLTVLILPSGDLLGRFRTLPTFLAAVSGFGLGSITCGLASSFPLLAHFGWSAVFFVNVPVCLLAALLGVLSLRGVRLGDRRLGSAYRQMGGLLRRSPFLGGLLAFFWSVSVGAALYYILPFDLSALQHIAPPAAGVILLCAPLGMGLMGPLGGYFTDRYGAKPFILTGSVLLFIGSLLLTLVAQSHTSELNLAWRLLLIGSGIGLFTGPNQTLLMSVGARETMGAASALSNLAGRLGSVCGTLVVGLTWTFLASFPAQMSVGMLIIDCFAVLNLLFAWVSVQRSSQHPSAAREGVEATSHSSNI